MKYYIVLILVLDIAFLNASRAQVFNYLPAKVNTHQVIQYSHFTICYNEEHEQAEWVAYALTKEEVETERKRCDCFASDSKIITKSAAPDDYSSSGFDMGHLSPAADNKTSEEANKESFLMSNMSPQLPLFNREKWEGLEEWVRNQAVKYSKIYIVTGPVFINNLGSIGKNKVTIPGYYYKVLLRFEGSKAKTIAFLLPQVGVSNNLKDYITTINTIETLTGQDFFPELDNKEENKVEAQYEPGNWYFDIVDK